MLHDTINSKRTLQKSCCLHCVIISPRRVRPQLTPLDDYAKIQNVRLHYNKQLLAVKKKKIIAIVIIISAELTESI